MQLKNRYTCDIDGLIYEEVERHLKDVKKTNLSSLIFHLTQKYTDAKASQYMNAINSMISTGKCIYSDPNTTDRDRVLEYVEYKKVDGRLDSLPAYIEAIKYLRSLFPNMIIDLEPEISSGTCSTSKMLKVSEKKCPICGELMFTESTISPRKYICKICKLDLESETESYSIITEGISTDNN